MKPGRTQLKTNFKKIKSFIFILGINNETNSRVFFFFARLN